MMSDSEHWPTHVRPVVIKYGGSLLDDHAGRSNFLKDVAALARREKVILVHGGGKEISKAVEEAGLPVRFVDGRRFTDKETMAVVVRVLGNINRHIVSFLKTAGVHAEGYSGIYNRLMIAEPVSDLGRVGVPRQVDITVLHEILKSVELPVFYSVAVDQENGLLNINADDFALALAVACRAARLVFMTDSGAILDRDKKPIESVTEDDVNALISDEIITGGMTVKARACVEALQKGVGEVDICKDIEALIMPGKKMEGTRFIQPNG
jgi:acetylglutamate kinase